MYQSNRTRVRLRPVLPALCLLAAPVFASQVRPVNLEQMTDRAAKIFEGRCVETSVTRDPQIGREVLTATFEVGRTVKGEVGSTITVRMLAGAGQEAGAREGTAGMPRFRPGDDVVLFLYGESDLGLSSPVGLGQGRFSVIEDKAGRRIAVNDMANKNLLRGLSPQARTSLGTDLDEWKDRKDVDPTALLDMAQSLSFATPEP